MSRCHALLFTLPIAALLACSKDPPAPAPAATVSAAAVAPSASAAIAAASASSEAKESPPSASATPSATAAAASGSAAAPETCGTKPLPDCPLQAWMKANVNPPVNKGDAPALAAALEKIAAMAPPGYTNWASISNDGATAAKSGDIPAAKASCRTCHDQYKAKYRSELRARKI